MIIDLSRDFWPKLHKFGIRKITFPSKIAFELYDTYGFPLDLTELMARERGLTVDKDGFEKLMEEQRARARAAQKKEVISLSQIETTTPTKFVGYEKLEAQAKVLEVVSREGQNRRHSRRQRLLRRDGRPGRRHRRILSQLGGSNRRRIGCTSSKMAADSASAATVTNTQKSGNTWLHFVAGETFPPSAMQSSLRVDQSRRNAIQRHHTVTHLLHWALHEVVSKEASQKGSFVGPDKLTFDFNSAPLTPQQVADIEKLVNERILENAGVSWTEVPYAEVKIAQGRDAILRRQIRRHRPRACKSAARQASWTVIRWNFAAARTRARPAKSACSASSAKAPLPPACGASRLSPDLKLIAKPTTKCSLIKTLAGKVNSPVHELEKKIESLLAHQKELEKRLKTAQQREASNAASLLLEEVKTINGIPAIIHNLGAADGDFLQAIADSLKGRFKGVIILGGVAEQCGRAGRGGLARIYVKNVQAGKIIQQIAPIVGGKGGGKPDNARGGGKDAGKLDEALAKAKSLLG